MVTVTNIKKHSSGDQIKVTATLASVANAQTWIVPHLTTIEDLNITCTTDDTISASYSGNTITFADGATLAGTIAVYGR